MHAVDHLERSLRQRSSMKQRISCFGGWRLADLSLSRSFPNNLVNDVTIELGTCSRLGEAARIGLYEGLKLAQVVKAHRAESIQDGRQVLPRNDEAPSAHPRRGARRVHARAAGNARRGGTAHGARCRLSTCISVAS
jgi:hypothetical protein